MDFLGIGPLELIFILIIALIIFGPNDIVKAGRTLGIFLRKIITSDGWRAFQQASKGMRNLPTTLIREAGLEEKDLRELTGMTDFEQATKNIENQIAPWTTPPAKKPYNSANPKGTSLPEEPSLPELETSSTEQETITTPEKPSTPQPGSPFSQTINDDDN